MITCTYVMYVCVYILISFQTEGLNLPFVMKHKNGCLLDFMKDDINKIPHYLRNFLQVNKQLFSALEYFEKGKVIYVHRDIKRKFHFIYYLLMYKMYMHS